MPIMGIVIAVILTLAAAVPVTWHFTSENHRKQDEIKVDSASARARQIIDDALEEAESKKRQALLEAKLEIKEETFKTKNELDKEIQERRSEVLKSERRIQQKEEQLDSKFEQLERREQSLAAKEENLQKLSEEVSKLNEQRIQELERISGLTSEQAKEHL
ncbi:MAG: Rnase Y domain-containing protein, partial [Eubacteriales bacterium]|nr:Rnase Y domain-containing protein [Eubacteriales bacterium]